MNEIRREIEDGGSAFPRPTVTHGGMSLRDYFAAKAMHAELVTSGVEGAAVEALIEASARAGRAPVLHLAFNAYEMADAMLKARKGKP